MDNSGMVLGHEIFVYTFFSSNLFFLFSAPPVEAISKQTDKLDSLIWPCSKDLTPVEVVQFPTFQG